MIFCYDDIYLEHDTGFGHPECPSRVKGINEAVNQASWFKDIYQAKVKPADIEVIALVHDRDYIERVERECNTGFPMLSTGDTNICRDSYEVALHAAGGVIEAVDQVFSSSGNKKAFCAVRPPGHHAGNNRGMGFCIFNNIAIAARYAQKKYRIDRVLIADWDIHHGNGTQDIFYEDDSVFYFSTHQYPLYPGTGHSRETGKGRGEGFTLNKPFPSGSGNDEIINSFQNDLLPRAKEFKPQLTLISAGFDSRINDPLGGFELDDYGFKNLTLIMNEISQIAGEDRMISVLEGGYNIKGVASAVLAHMQEML